MLQGKPHIFFTLKNRTPTWALLSLDNHSFVPPRNLVIPVLQDKPHILFAFKTRIHRSTPSIAPSPLHPLLQIINPSPTTSLVMPMLQGKPHIFFTLKTRTPTWALLSLDNHSFVPPRNLVIPVLQDKPHILFAFKTRIHRSTPSIAPSPLHPLLQIINPSPTTSLVMPVLWGKPLIFFNFKIKTHLTGGNWQKWKRVFLTCPCHEIYREEAVGLKSCKYTWKITKFVKMGNLGQYRENLIFCQ